MLSCTQHSLSGPEGGGRVCFAKARLQQRAWPHPGSDTAVVLVGESCTHAHMQTCTHTHTHSLTHSHTHTHTHTHTQATLQSFTDAHHSALSSISTLHSQLASCRDHIEALKAELSAVCSREMAGLASAGLASQSPPPRREWETETASRSRLLAHGPRGADTRGTEFVALKYVPRLH